MIKLIIFITKSEIFAYDMSDMTAPVQIGFEGNESVQLSDTEAIESCCSCITERYNVDVFSDDDFDFVIIDCNAKKKYIPEFAKKVQTCRKMSVYPLEKLIVPALINSSRVPEDTVYVSYGEFTYKVFSSEGVYCTEKVKRDDADIKLTEADFSFVFNFRESSAHSSAADVKTAEDTAQLAELNAEIEKLTEKLSENEQTIVTLRNKNAEIIERESEKKQNLPTEEYVDNLEIKEKLKVVMNDNFPLDDYIVNVRDWNDKKLYTICCAKSQQMYSFPIEQSADEIRTFSIIGNALLCMSEHSKVLLSEYAALTRGDVFAFGKFKGKPILWRVLDKSNGILKIITDNVICSHEFDSSRADNDKWENSDLYNWLNGVFYRNSFNDVEKSLINNGINLLSTKGVATLFDDAKDRALKECAYWTSDIGCEYAYYVGVSGELNKYAEQPCRLGVRPYLELKYL